MRIDKIDTTPLRELIEREGMVVREFPLGWRKQLEESFVEYNGDSVGHEGEFFTLNGVPVVIYIKSTEKNISSIRANPHDDYVPRVHFAPKCETIKKMKEMGAYEKYVYTRRRTGYFIIDAWARDLTKLSLKREYKTFDNEKLHVCRHCLSYIDYEGYKEATPAQKTIIVENFDYDYFFVNYAGGFSESERPSDSDIIAPLGSYNDAHRPMAIIVKNEAGWKCEECKVDLNAYRHLLHAHHINHKKSDIFSGNYKALCVLCHRDKHRNNRLMNHAANEHGAQIKKLRKSQGIKV